MKVTPANKCKGKLKAAPTFEIYKTKIFITGARTMTLSENRGG
jgi:hypothetical protein